MTDMSGYDGLTTRTTLMLITDVGALEACFDRVDQFMVIEDDGLLV